MGLQSNAARLREYTAKMKEKGLEAIGQIARDGDRVGNIAAGEKQVFSNLAMERFSAKIKWRSMSDWFPVTALNLRSRFVPRTSPSAANQPEVIETGQHLDIRYEPGVVDIYLAVEPSMDVVV